MENEDKVAPEQEEAGSSSSIQDGAEAEEKKQNATADKTKSGVVQETINIKTETPQKRLIIDQTDRRMMNLVNRGYITDW
jgi:hypothetical protein